jgi:hypothetical protein
MEDVVDASFLEPPQQHESKGRWHPILGWQVEYKKGRQASGLVKDDANKGRGLLQGLPDSRLELMGQDAAKEANELTSAASVVNGLSAATDSQNKKQK